MTMLTPPLLPARRRGAVHAPALALLVAAAMLMASSAPAQSQDRDIVLPDLADTYVPVRPADDALYQALGGEAGVPRLVDAFLARVLADARTRPFFAPVDHAELKKQLALEFCTVSGGPCSRKRNVRRLHSSMDIAKVHFNAVVECLQQAMDQQGVSFRDQNRFLALLAPMHRDIVNVD